MYRSVSADMPLASWPKEGVAAAQGLLFPSIWGEGLQRTAAHSLLQHMQGCRGKGLVHCCAVGDTVCPYPPPTRVLTRKPMSVALICTLEGVLEKGSE